MLTKKEEEFLLYWESRRLQESTFMSKLTRGIPMALMFGLPILLFIAAIYLFFPDWYYKISGTTASTFRVVVIAVLICIVFFSYFRMHFKWEMSEQAYQELKNKSLRSNAANK